MLDYIVHILLIVFGYMLYDVIKYYIKKARRKRKQDKGGFLEWL